MATNEDSCTISASPADAPSGPGAPGATNPAALTVEQAARILTAVGGKLTTVETIRRHIAAGAPVAADGRLNLVQYAAWLNKELAKDDGD